MRWIPFGNGREIATELPQCDCCKLVEMRAETKSEACGGVGLPFAAKSREESARKDRTKR